MSNTIQNTVQSSYSNIDDIQFSTSDEQIFIKSPIDNVNDNINVEGMSLTTTRIYSDDAFRNLYSLSKSNLYGMSYYKKTQKWIGHITDIYVDSFKAKLTDLTSPGTYEIDEFDLEEITDEDKPLLSLGATFYWSVGYSTSENGQVTKESLIRFQRIVEFTDEDNSEALDRASHLISTLKWE